MRKTIFNVFIVRNKKHRGSEGRGGGSPLSLRGRDALTATLAPANLINRRRRCCHTAGKEAVSRGEMTQRTGSRSPGAACSSAPGGRPSAAECLFEFQLGANITPALLPSLPACCLARRPFGTPALSLSGGGGLQHRRLLANPPLLIHLFPYYLCRSRL